ncbi:3150_t:CDS:1, partial [Ambispora leptoticha]
EAKHLKINLTLKKIKPFFTLEIEEKSEEGKVEISVSIENKPKN